MKILFDHNLPRRLREHLPGHEIHTTREMKWEQLRNGALMSVAAGAGFEVFVTIDKQIEHQQNLAALLLTVVVVDGKSNALPALLPFTPYLRDLFASSLERALYVVEEGGSVLQLKEPRKAADWVKNWVKIASKTLEMLKNAGKRRERVSDVFLFGFKKLRRVSKRTEKAGLRF